MKGKTMGKPVEHGPQQAMYNNLGPFGQEPTIVCLCGHTCKGPTWESVGEVFDEHLEQADEEHDEAEYNRSRGHE
jgi:hypothetical protein